MIPRTETILQREKSWQAALADLVRDPMELLALLQLDPADQPGGQVIPKHFPLRVPRGYVARMRPGDWQDPLLLQVLPTAAETLAQPGYRHDPLEEVRQNPRPGLIHKYHGRVLLVMTSACAIHCRYCFRQHFPYADNRNSRQQWTETLQYIAGDDSISEVILSGGDPLSVSDDSLSELLDSLERIPHLRRLRIHSRLPVVLPERITAALCNRLQQSRLQVVMVIHCNHAQELDQEVAAALSALRDAGITLLNQTVLLAGINDRADTLVTLSERLFALGVLPYYLHLLDKVQGAAHFDLEESRATALYRQLLAQLPGYLVPKLVRESANVPFKMPIPPTN